VDKAAWGPAVLAGLLGATFSSALSSLVGSARILQAMSEHRILPRSSWLSQLTDKGEPRHAMAVTGLVVFASLLFRDLNAIAPFITLFYLITYAMINAVVLIEQRMGLVSFRPLLTLPAWVPALGLTGSLVAMFVIQPVLSLLSVAVVVFFYVVLLRRHIEAPFGDMRSGLFVTLAEWAAKKVAELPPMQERAWKVNLLIPVEDPSAVRGSFALLRDLTWPKGSVRLLGLGAPDGDRLEARVYSLANAFRDQGVFASRTVVEAPAGYAETMVAVLQTLRGAFFRSNIVCLELPETDERQPDYARIQEEAARERVGMLVLAPHPRSGLGQRRVINVWIRDRSPDWRVSMDMGNLDLPLLLGYKLLRNWDATMRLICVVDGQENVEDARHFLTAVLDLARIPRTRVMALAEDYDSYVPQAPQADVNIFGLGREPDFAFMRRMVQDTRSTCLFARDSGQESVLA